MADPNDGKWEAGEPLPKPVVYAGWAIGIAIVLAIIWELISGPFEAYQAAKAADAASAQGLIDAQTRQDASDEKAKTSARRDRATSDKEAKCRTIADRAAEAAIIFKTDNWNTAYNGCMQ